MALLTGSVTGLSLNGGSRALNASYAGKVPVLVIATPRRRDPGWIPLILETGTRFECWLFLLYWALDA